VPRPKKNVPPTARWTADDLLAEMYPIGGADLEDLLLRGPELDPSDWSMADVLLEMYSGDDQLRWVVLKRRQEWIKEDPERPERQDPPWIERYGARKRRTA
jgi:hypothetical protein